MEEFKLYHYDPSFIAAIIFVALFSVSALGHLFQLVRFRTWFFIPFFIGCAFESIGYVGSAISAKQTPDWALMPYVLQSLLLLLGPTMLAASIYMALARLIVLLDATSYSLVSVDMMTKVFVLGDVISFLAQSGGGGIMANAKSAGDQKKGWNIIIVGLAVQIYFFGFFVAVMHVFHRRIIAEPTRRSFSLTVPWRRFIYVLYVASALIMIRSIFRIAEYVSGTNGKLQSTEAYIYAFDASLICITTILFNIFHPRQLTLTPEAQMKALDDEGRRNSVPLQASRQTTHTIDNLVPSPPVRHHPRVESSYLPHNLSQIDRQSLPNRQYPQAHRMSNPTLSSGPDRRSLARGQNPYSGHYELLMR